MSKLHEIRETAQLALAAGKQAEAAEAKRIAGKVVDAAAKLTAQREAVEDLTQRANAAELRKLQEDTAQQRETRLKLDAWVGWKRANPAGTKEQFDTAWSASLRERVMSDEAARAVQQRQSELALAVKKF